MSSGYIAYAVSRVPWLQSAIYGRRQRRQVAILQRLDKKRKKNHAIQQKKKHAH